MLLDQIKLVIFDLDGVLVATDVLHFQAWKQTITKHLNLTLASEDIHLVRGVPRRDSLLALLNKYHKTLSEKEIQALLKIKNEAYVALLKTLKPEMLKKNAYQLLTFLKQKQILIGLGSSSFNAEAILKKLNIASFFDIIIDLHSIKKFKPDPELFLAVANKAKIRAYQKCLVIEDAQAGINAAKAANMIAVAFGNDGPLSNYDYQIKDLLALKDL